MVFPSVEKVGAKPAAAQDVAPGGPVGGRLRSIAKPLMLPHMVTESSAATINPMTVAAHDVAPGRGRASSQSILRPLKPSVPPHKATPSHQPASDLPYRNMGHLERTHLVHMAWMCSSRMVRP